MDEFICKRAVYEDDVIKLLNRGWKSGVYPLAYDVRALPSAQPEREKGEWLANGDIPKECPFCGEDWDKYVFGDIWYTGELPKFCPNCGADMRGEKNE